MEIVNLIKEPNFKMSMLEKQSQGSCYTNAMSGNISDNTFTCSSHILTACQAISDAHPIHSFIPFIHFILKTLQETTTTQRCSQPSHGQRRGT